jgi:putative oxidoreductase
MPLTRSKQLRLVAAWCLALYLARMYVGMGWIKFDPNGFWTAAFESWGYPVWLRWLVGGVEVTGGILLLVPWVASYAAVALGLVMAGAWMTRVRDARFVDVAWITAYFVALVWIAFEWWQFRRPRLELGGWGRRAAGAGERPE